MYGYDDAQPTKFKFHERLKSLRIAADKATEFERNAMNEKWRAVGRYENMEIIADQISYNPIIDKEKDKIGEET